MAWEKRPSGSFYYRSVRVGRAVRKQYVGAGPVAEIESAADEESRNERRLADERELEAVARSRPADDLLGRFFRECSEQLERAFHEAGFHRHKRGQWRKKRGEEKEE